MLARELGFAEKEGVDLQLVRDFSWATVRDRMLYGQSDAAHLIAPLAIATSLGLDRAAVRLSVPFVLGLNGNAITVAPSLAAGITGGEARSEEHTSELQSLMRNSYAVFCLKKKN